MVIYGGVFFVLFFFFVFLYHLQDSCVHFNDFTSVFTPVACAPPVLFIYFVSFAHLLLMDSFLLTQVWAHYGPKSSL